MPETRLRSIETVPDDVLVPIGKKCYYVGAVGFFSASKHMRRLWTPELEKWFREGAVVLIQEHMRSSLRWRSPGSCAREIAVPNWNAVPMRGSPATSILCPFATWAAICTVFLRRIGVLWIANGPSTG